MYIYTLWARSDGQGVTAERTGSAAQQTVTRNHMETVFV